MIHGGGIDDKQIYIKMSDLFRGLSEFRMSILYLNANWYMQKEAELYHKHWYHRYVISYHFEVSDVTITSVHSSITIKLHVIRLIHTNEHIYFNYVRSSAVTLKIIYCSGNNMKNHDCGS